MSAGTIETLFSKWWQIWSDETDWSEPEMKRLNDIMNEYGDGLLEMQPITARDFAIQFIVASGDGAFVLEDDFFAAVRKIVGLPAKPPIPEGVAQS